MFETTKGLKRLNEELLMNSKALSSFKSSSDESTLSCNLDSSSNFQASIYILKLFSLIDREAEVACF